jgi:hypothetical protein
MWQTVPNFRDSKNAFYAIYTSSLATCRNKDFVPTLAREKNMRFRAIQSIDSIVADFLAIRANQRRLEFPRSDASTRRSRAAIACTTKPSSYSSPAVQINCRSPDCRLAQLPP